MRTMLQVLMRTLALFLRNCADFLFLQSEPAAGLPAMGAVRPPGPPQDWLRRVNPPPPAHWVELVRRRAPRFLASSPEPLLAASVDADPQFRGPGFLSRSTPSVPSGPRPVPHPSRGRKEGSPQPTLPLIRSSLTAPDPAPRRLRVVTSLQESPRPLPMPEPEAAPVPNVSKPVLSEAEPRPAPAPKRPTLDLFPRLIHARIPIRPPAPLPPAARLALAGSPEAAWECSPFRDRESSELRLPVRHRSASAGIDSEGFAPSRREVFLGVSTADPVRPTIEESADSSGMPSWPDLPPAPEADVTEECLALVREQRRLDARDAEQRGKPWNA